MSNVQDAVDNFKKGYNCSQSVVTAYCERFGFDKREAAKMAEGFGGGMGRMRRECGAVTAMFMLAGMKYSNGEPGDIKTRAFIYQVVRDMAAEFEKKNGTIICAELLGKAKPKDDSATPEPRTDEYYKRRPCIGCISDCAEIVEKYLLSE